MPVNGPIRDLAFGGMYLEGCSVLYPPLTAPPALLFILVLIPAPNVCFLFRPFSLLESFKCRDKDLLLAAHPS
jgi:hypothetical protein